MPGEVLNSKDYLASLKSLPGKLDVSDSKKRENLLNRKFDENPNPSKAEMETMATMFGMEPATVRLWYRKRRAQGKRKGNNNDIASDDGRTNTVIAPTGGYPLPIINKARLVDAAPETASTANQISNSTHELESPTPYPSAWEELCSDEFVPPNIDFRPDQIKNGEIVLFPGGDGRKGQGYPKGNEDCRNQSENRYKTPNQRHVYQKHHLVSSVGGDNSCYIPPQGGFDCLKSPRDKPVLLPEYLRHQHNQQTSLQHRNYDVTATHQTNRLLPVSSYPAATCSSLVASTSSASSPLSGNEISDSNNTTSNINSNNSNFADVNMSGALAPQRHLHQEHREGHQHHQRQQQYMSLFPLTQAKTAVTAQP
ncbi:hypothetical protein RRG08_050460 [Elysia crispata]|uniref:Homeobox domain-containing protein n=1 Tax=Elysia crispata TaxID=231223 RepID=A0AAE0ZL08_9GAST|nr:hypothetical protein RRG08_050460 [Elysia crispata]